MKQNDIATHATVGLTHSQLTGMHMNQKCTCIVSILGANGSISPSSLLGTLTETSFNPNSVEATTGTGLSIKAKSCAQTGSLLGPLKAVPGSPVRKSRPIQKQLVRHRR